MGCGVCGVKNLTYPHPSSSNHSPRSAWLGSAGGRPLIEQEENWQTSVGSKFLPAICHISFQVLELSIKCAKLLEVCVLSSKKDVSGFLCVVNQSSFFFVVVHIFDHTR